MVRCTSLFSQVLGIIDRNHFARAVRDRQAERAAKGFRCWDQFVAMLFCHMASANSLREICGGLATALGKLAHLGLKDAPARSTLSYANNRRPWRVFEDVFCDVLARCQDLASTKGRRFRFKNPLRSLDSTVIELCAEVFDWAKYRRTKGAVKLHLQLDHQGCLPCWAVVTEGKKHDVRLAQGLSFAPGTIAAVDKGYWDYALFGRWTAGGVFFVTRAKSNMAWRTVASRPVPKNSNVLSDRTVVLAGPGAWEKCPHELRLVSAWDPEQQRVLTFLTNIHHLAARTVAAIYKDRWQIEIFFKALKQTLKVKAFVGTRENAVQTQIWTALIAMLLLKFLQLKSQFGWSLSNLAALLRMSLLTYRDLWAWLDCPFDTPVEEPAPKQLSFFPT
jgi:hypothetical protein